MEIIIMAIFNKIIMGIYLIRMEMTAMEIKEGS
jgi:hypothetical protein